MIVSAVTVSFRQNTISRHSTRPIYDFLDLNTDTIHRYINSNHSMIAEHPVVQHLFQLLCVFFLTIHQPSFYSFTLCVSAAFNVLLNYFTLCETFSPPHVFYHIIHHLFSLSVTLLRTHLLSSSHTYMRKPFVTSLLRFDKAVCASGTGGMTAVEMTKRDEQKKNSKEWKFAVAYQQSLLLSETVYEEV